MVQYGCKSAADLVQLFQISKAGGGLPVLVYRTKLLAGHLCNNTQSCLGRYNKQYLFQKKVTEYI